MKRPVQYKERVALNSLTGIKSSLAQIRSVVALTYLLYLANDKKPSICYSVTNDNQSISLKDEYNSFINNFLGNTYDNNNIESNPLLTSQIESLYVGITLMFGLGKISFEDTTLSMTKERTGGKRYPKKIDFASNIILLDLILQQTEIGQRKQFLSSWLQNHKLENNDLELSISTFLNICIEKNLFKLRNGSNDLFFQTEGIYLALNDDDVSLKSDETVGPARILNSMLREGLIPWLSTDNYSVKINKDCNFDVKSYTKILSTSLDIRDIKVDAVEDISTETNDLTSNQNHISANQYIDFHINFLLALRTKPFLLLAGISGTGKSRIVREFAFKSCPKFLQDKDGTTPGNYCMIEVKPNWHDSTELLGYYSNLSKGYQFKKFVKFLVKAKMFPDVPFFVCLDEMNIAPVEQYFAEILSILETRKHPKYEGYDNADMNTIKTEIIIDAKYFRELEEMPNTRNSHTGESFSRQLTDRDIYMKLFDIDTENDILENVGSRNELTTEGLSLPDNVLIIGTVNMDDTTHQFSRKVIDRALTIEMNGGKLSDMFGGSKKLEYTKDEDEQKFWQQAFSQHYVTADEVIEKHPNEAEGIKSLLPQKLDEINKALRGTPFEVSYRVLNELTIMVGVMLDDNNDGKSLESIIDNAVNNILLMKILPRIEGDAEMFALSKEYTTQNDIKFNDRLEWLKAIAPDIHTENQQTAKQKIQEMIDRLYNQDFTRFWP